jgi:hypothetical protein
MGRVLLYPVIGFVVAGVLAAATAAIVITLAQARAKHARRRARWEVVTSLDAATGNAIVGIHLVARWGHHREILKRHPDTETVPADDFLAIIEAQTRAQTQALNFNNIEKQQR